MMKSARKKLKKFWSKKKKKKKTHYIEDAHHHCSRCSYSSYPSYAYPSAPPLPPNWAEFGLGYENSSDQDHNTAASIHQLEISESNQIEEAAAGADYLISSSYQQYMSSNPVFDLPVSENKVRAAGFFSCVFKQISSPAGKSFTSWKRRTDNRDCLTYLALDSKCEI